MRRKQPTSEARQRILETADQLFYQDGVRGVAIDRISFSEFLRGLVESTIDKAAANAAPAVTILVEGALVTAVIQGNADAADVARDAALKLVCDEKGV